MSKWFQRLQEQSLNIFASLGLVWLWVSLVLSILGRLDLSSLEVESAPVFSVTFSYLCSMPVVGGIILASPAAMFFSAVVLAPILEEAAFRLLPLEIGAALGPRVLVAVQFAICGLLFGMVHGHWYNVLIQGFLGYVASVLYLRNGTVSVRAGYLSCVALHAAYNFIVLVNS